MKSINIYLVAGLLLVSAGIAVWVTTGDQFRYQAIEPVLSTDTEASKHRAPASIIADGNLKAHEQQTGVSLENILVESGETFSTQETSESDARHLVDEIELMVSRFNDLMYIDSPDFSMEGRIAVEEDILMFVEENSDAVSQVFNLYENSDDYEYKQAVIDVLSMIENPQVEQFALEQVNSEFNDHTQDWLQILRSTGISSSDDRADMLSRLYQFSEPTTLSHAISTLKFRPVPVAQSERQEIVSQLQTYLSHEDPRVRQAASAVIANWNLGSREDAI